MTRGEIKRRASAWIVPPACQGQMVEIAYSHDIEGDGIGFRRVTDLSDPHDEPAYAVCDMDDCGCAGQCGCYDPANSEPKGFRWHRVEQ